MQRLWNEGVLGVAGKHKQEKHMYIPQHIDDH